MRAVYRGGSAHARMIATVGPVAWSPVALVIIALALVAIPAGCRPRMESRAGAPTRLAETRRFMAVPWTVTVHAADEETGRRAVDAAFAEIARIEAILTDYDPDSELSRLSAAAPMAEPVPVSEDLWTVLERAGAIRDATNGGFDLTVGPLTTLWRRARRAGRLPPADKLAAAQAAVGAESLALDPATRTVRLTRPGMRLDAGGIGRGYALDRALDVLSAHGITSAMIDCSGDVIVSGPPPGAPGWRIAVRPFVAAVHDHRAGEQHAGEQHAGEQHDGEQPAAPLMLAHAAVTTSGDAYQFVEIDGVRYSHIIDPRTGLGVTGQTAVTVIAPDATTADALATALSVLGPEAGHDVVNRFPGCAARFMWLKDGSAHLLDSPGWPGTGPWKKPVNRP
jgi:thiamine biosynthesis lipoprotein